MSYNPFSLEGKNILITGATSGIGRQTAIECSKLGASLILAGRNPKKMKSLLEELQGQNHNSFLGDLREEENIISLVSKCPKLNGAVLCSGTAMTLPVKFSSIDKFKTIFDLNLFAQTELSRLLFKSKKIVEEASLIFMASIGGTFTVSPGNAIYGASKAALNSYMKFCALEFSSRKIRVNSICPGMVETPLIHRGDITEEQLDKNAASYPMKRYGIPKDVALGAIYLLSDASKWVTGISLRIDGGISIT